MTDLYIGRKKGRNPHWRVRVHPIFLYFQKNTYERKRQSRTGKTLYYMVGKSPPNHHRHRCNSYSTRTRRQNGGSSYCCSDIVPITLWCRYLSSSGNGCPEDKTCQRNRAKYPQWATAKMAKYHPMKISANASKRHTRCWIHIQRTTIDARDQKDCHHRWGNQIFWTKAGTAIAMTDSPHRQMISQ